MSQTPAESEWGFADPQDAARYLQELLRLWVVWIAGLAVLMTNSGWILVVGGVAVIGLLLWFARPIQRRAEALVPTDSAYDKGSLVRGKGTTRDRAIKALAYGEEPLEEAVDLTGQSGAWLFGRKGMIAITAIAFGVVVLQAFGS